MATYPLILLVTFIYFVIRCGFKPRKMSQAYLFRGEEFGQMKEVLGMIDHFERELIDISEEGEDLERRSDGFYDGRSYNGRRLNKRLEETNKGMALAKECESELKEKVQNRLSSWNFNRTGRAVFFAALIGYMPVAILGAPTYAVLASIMAAIAMWLFMIVRAEELGRYTPNAEILTDPSSNLIRPPRLPSV
jgi:hypothetical protein